MRVLSFCLGNETDHLRFRIELTKEQEEVVQELLEMDELEFFNLEILNPADPFGIGWASA